MFCTLRPPQKTSIFGVFLDPKSRLQRRGQQIGSKTPLERPLGSPGACPGSKKGAKRVPRGVPRGAQNEPKIVFLRVLGRMCEKRVPKSSPKGSPGTPRGSKLSQNGPKIVPRMGQKRNHTFGAAVERSLEYTRAASRLERRWHTLIAPPR